MARRTVTDFIDAIGYDVLDTGSLADSRQFQRDQSAYAGAYAEHGDFDEPKRADRAELQALLDRADASIPYHRPDQPHTDRAARVGNAHVAATLPARPGG